MGLLERHDLVRVEDEVARLAAQLVRLVAEDLLNALGRVRDERLADVSGSLENEHGAWSRERMDTSEQEQGWAGMAWEQGGRSATTPHSAPLGSPIGGCSVAEIGFGGQTLWQGASRNSTGIGCIAQGVWFGRRFDM